MQSIGGTSSENSRPENMREKNAFETKTSPVAYISDFQIIVIREKRQYLKRKQK